MIRSYVSTVYGKLTLAVVVGMMLATMLPAIFPSTASAQTTCQNATYDPAQKKCVGTPSAADPATGIVYCDPPQTYDDRTSQCLSDPLPDNPGGNGGATAGNASGAQDDNSPTLSCEILTANPINWFICPVVTGLQGAVNGLNGAIDAMLTIDTDKFFDFRMKQAWGQFRLIAIGLIIVAGLLMFAAQAIGLEILDAYTVRKIIPRLIVAIILISISWDLCKFLIGLSNDAGNSVRAIIYYPFRGLPGEGGRAISLGDWSTFTALLVGIAGFAILGPVALASFLVTAALAVGVGFIVLLLRQMIIVMLVTVAPIALACYVLPNTQKAYEFWKNSFISMLVIFPIISAFIAVGRVFSLISYDNSAIPSILSQIIAFIAFFIPYLALPFAFRLAGGLLATVGGIVNDRSRGGFDRLKKFRQSRASQRYQDAKAGRGGFVGADTLGKAYRRASLGGNVLTRRGRAHYRGQVNALTQATADDILKRDNGRMANDDTANSLALQKGMTRGKFIEQYAAKLQSMDSSLSYADARDTATNSLGQLEASYGARLGSNGMRLAAFKARAASSTGYGLDPELMEQGRFDEADQKMRAEMMEDASSILASGLMTQSDAVMAFKSNKSRADINGPGFNAQIKQINKSLKRYQEGKPRDQLIDIAEAAELSNDALKGVAPGALISGRKETVQVLAPRMHERLVNAFAGGNEQTIMREAAAIAGRYDAMAQIQPQNAEIMDNGVMGRNIRVNGEDMTVRAFIDRNRNNGFFQNMRREYQQTELRGAGGAPPTPSMTGPQGPGHP